MTGLYHHFWGRGCVHGAGWGLQRAQSTCLLEGDLQVQMLMAGCVYRVSGVLRKARNITGCYVKSSYCSHGLYSSDIFS